MSLDLFHRHSALQRVLPSSSVGEESLSPNHPEILPADFDAGSSLALNI